MPTPTTVIIDNDTFSFFVSVLISYMKEKTDKEFSFNSYGGKSSILHKNIELITFNQCASGSGMVDVNMTIHPALQLINESLYKKLSVFKNKTKNYATRALTYFDD